jgi:hypothetical protein
LDALFAFSDFFAAFAAGLSFMHALPGVNFGGWLATHSGVAFVAASLAQCASSTT